MLLLSATKKFFQRGLGLVKDVKAKLYVNTEAWPLFFKAHSVPYALRQKVEHELDRLQKQDVITPVSHSDWAAPIVPVTKRDSSVRVCGDYKLTANEVLKIEMYPFHALRTCLPHSQGVKYFQSHAYLHQLVEEFQKYLVINTYMRTQ